MRDLSEVISTVCQADNMCKIYESCNYYDCYVVMTCFIRAWEYYVCSWYEAMLDLSFIMSNCLVEIVGLL